MSLERAMTRALTDAPLERREGLTVVAFECSLDLEGLVAHLTPQTFGSLVLWDTRASEMLAGEFTVGIGTAHEVVASGAGRFAETRDALARVLDNVGDPRVRAFGGFAFDGGSLGDFEPFRHARFVIPRWTFSERADGTVTGLLVAQAAAIQERGRLLLEARALDLAASPKGRKSRMMRRRSVSLADDGASAFRAGVEAAVVAIEAFDLEKVVLARVARVRHAPAANEVLPRLSGAAGCVRFGFQVEGAAFVGATPETLLSFDGRVVRTEAVAGTEPRRGADLAEASRLLLRDKDRREHALVVASILRDLQGLGVDVVAADEPRLRTLTHLHHLVTPMVGTITANLHVIDLVAGMHPTPAMGGVPRKQALAFVHAHETVARGHYAAPIGWVAAGGKGDFVVGIRSALLLPESALLFAGAGIVRGSIPELELAETGAKLKTMLSALSAGPGPRRQPEDELGV